MYYEIQVLILPTANYATYFQQLSVSPALDDTLTTEDSSDDEYDPEADNLEGEEEEEEEDDKEEDEDDDEQEEEGDGENNKHITTSEFKSGEREAPSSDGM